MRGSIFYDSSRLTALETSKSFQKHRENLQLINNRLSSNICKHTQLFHYIAAQ
jgi:hypothetical protein